MGDTSPRPTPPPSDVSDKERVESDVTRVTSPVTSPVIAASSSDASSSDAAKDTPKMASLGRWLGKHIFLLN